MVTYQSILTDIANSLELELIIGRGTVDVLEGLVKAAEANASQGRDQSAKLILQAFKDLVKLAAGTLKLITGVAPQVLEGDAQSLISQLPQK